MIAPLFVPDASVALKWAIADEPQWREQADALKDAAVQGDCRLIVPEIFWLEALNQLVRNGFGRQGKPLSQILQVFQNYLLETEKFSIQRTYSLGKMLAEEFGQGNRRATSYDLAYVLLAQRAEGTLVTADDLQLKMAHRSGAKGIHIKDYQ